MIVTFSDHAHANGTAIPTVLNALAGWTVDIDYTVDTGYPSPGVIKGTDADGDLVIHEADANGAPFLNSTWAVPLEVIERVTVV